MFKSPLYLAYGFLMVGMFGAAEYTGFGLMGPSPQKGGPKTLRDNPGASRPHYGVVPRYVGGK